MKITDLGSLELNASFENYIAAVIVCRWRSSGLVSKLPTPMSDEA